VLRSAGPPHNQQRYEKHRIKLSVDVSKLIQNQDGLQSVLGQTVLKRWFFIIPEHDNKQLVVFANKKSQEVRAKCLPFISPDFEIQIHDDGAFPAARNKLLGAPAWRTGRGDRAGHAPS
jgi:hypothetical protein